MRISKSNKTDVKAATEPNEPDWEKTQLVQECIKKAEEVRDYFQNHNNNLNSKQDQYLEDLSDGIDSQSIMAIREAIENLKYNSKNMRKEQFYLVEDLYDEFNLAGGKFEGMGRPGSDVSASRKIKSGRWINGLNNKVIYDDGGIKVTTTGRDYDIIAVIENDTDEVFCVNIYEPDYEDPEDCNVVVQPHDYIGVLADDEGYDIVEYFENLAGGVKACGDIKGSKKLSANDQALSHIKAAIDILGKSGKKDDVTKDSIANLATVMFDIKSSKKN